MEQRTRLTGREREILELIAQSLANAQIAERLGISPNTLRNHITSIFGKLGAATRAEAIELQKRGQDPFWKKGPDPFSEKGS